MICGLWVVVLVLFETLKALKALKTQKKDSQQIKQMKQMDSLAIMYSHAGGWERAKELTTNEHE